MVAIQTPLNVEDTKKIFASLLSRADGKIKCAFVKGSTRMDGTSELPQKCRDRGCLGSFDKAPLEDQLPCFAQLDISKK